MKKKLSIEDADKEQNDLVNKLIGIEKGKITVRKRSFLNNTRLFLSAREKSINIFKSKILPIKNLDKIPASETTPEPTSDPTEFDRPKPTKHKRGDLNTKHLH